MTENPYQAPQQDRDQDRSVGSDDLAGSDDPSNLERPALAPVFWHMCLFLAALIFLLFSFGHSALWLRLGCGLAVAVAVWSFMELAKLGYGTDTGTGTETAAGDADDDRPRQD